MTERSVVEQAVRHLAARHPVTGMILHRWDAVQLPDVWLSGSLLAQTRWNEAFGFPPFHGIADADIIYFDAADLSEAAERTAAARLSDVFADLPVRIDVKNQARVHLWYPDRFGTPIDVYRSAIDATLTFPTTASAVAITPEALSAPFGLTDLLDPVVRANAAQIDQAYYEAKARRWAACWPDLTILPWHHAIRPAQESTPLQ